MAFDVTDKLVTECARGKAHIAPVDIPWFPLQRLLLETIYGGRVDNKYDFVLLECIVHRLFGEHVFSSDFSLAEADSSGISAPEACSYGAVVEWIKSMPEPQQPAWLHLPSDADVGLTTQEGVCIALPCECLPSHVLVVVQVGMCCCG
jgi:dynein heavy chain 1, cytosolic